MKIAVISDIHGNQIALAAVLKCIRRLNISKIFVLGDLVGYYYDPDRVLELLAPWECELVQGNHERMLAVALENQNCLPEIKEKYGSGIQFAINKLSPSQLDFLITLPTHKTITFDNLTFSLSHGAPWDQNIYIYPDTTEEVFQKFAKFPADFILMGHTHYPFVRTFENSLIVNPGSVGQARDVGQMASWCVIDTTSRSLVFQHTPFEVKQLLAEVQAIDPEVAYLSQILLR